MFWVYAQEDGCGSGFCQCSDMDRFEIVVCMPNGEGGYMGYDEKMAFWAHNGIKW
jgi:hypothetical protein